MRGIVGTSRRARGSGWLACVGLLIVAACGDDGSELFARTGDSDATSRRGFEERAEAACAELWSDVIMDVADTADPADMLDPTGEALPPEDAQRLGLRLAERTDQLIAELREIGPPEGYVDEWSEWIDLIEQDIEEIRDDPAAAFVNGTDAVRWDRINELTHTLGVPGCGDENPPGLSDEATEALAQIMAGAFQAESGGLITDAEANCIGTGLADMFLESFAEGGDLDFEQLPPEQQGAFLEVFIDCRPAEKLVQLDDM